MTGGHPPAPRRPGDLAAGAVSTGGWWLFVAVVVLLLAPAGLAAWAVAAGAVRYGARRWHLAAAGACLAAVVVWRLGPAMAAVAGAGLADLSGAVGRSSFAPGGPWRPLLAWFTRWAVLTLPAGISAGMIAAAVTPAGELANRPEWDAARRRQEQRTDARRRRRAGRRAGREGGRRESGALAIHLAGATIWTRRPGGLVVPPDGQLGLAWLLIGAPGAGKSVAACRLAYLCGLERRHLVVVDAKGGHDGLAQEVVEAYRAGWAAAGAGAPMVRLFPDEPLDIWRGSPQAVVNRLVEVWEWTAESSWHREPIMNALRLALSQPGPPCTSGRELVRRLDPTRLAQAWQHAPEELALVRHLTGLREGLAGIHLRVANLVAALGGLLDGASSWEDADCWVVTVPAMVAKRDADSVLRVLLTDYAHFTMARKPAGQPAHLLVDEFSAIDGGRQVAIDLLERGRGAGTGVTLSAQSYTALGPVDQRDRLLSAAGCILLFRTPLPAGLAQLAGVERVADGAWQTEAGELTGRATYRTRERARVDQDAVRQLATGEAELIVRGLSARVRIVRTDAARLSATVRRVRPAAGELPGLPQPRPLGAAAGNPAPSDGPAGLGDGRGVAVPLPARPGPPAATRRPAGDLDPPRAGRLRRQRPAPPGQGDPPDAQDNQEAST